jgi:DNA-binding CsgD family transcriptional regulator
MELLDREQELAALNDLVESIRRGFGAALFLRGEPGVGLSSLLDWVVGSASGIHVVRLTGVEAERGLPFAAVHRLCASWLGWIEGLPGPQRDVLATAFGLRRGGGVDGFILAAGVLALLEKAAEEEPLLGVVDDAQRLDSASADALGVVARRLSDKPVGLVLAAHEPLAAQTPFAGLRELRVEGLGRDAARKLLRRVVEGPLDEGVRERLIAEAAGIPLGLVELPAHLTAVQRGGLAGLPRVLPVGEHLRKRLLAPVEELPAETRLLLLLVAAEPEATLSLFWSAASRLGISAQAAAPAEAVGLVRIGERISFRHPLLRLAVYEAAPLWERQRAHQAFVDAIDPEADLDRRVWHRAAAALTADEEVALDLEAAAARARGRGDYSAAAGLLEQAADLTPDAVGRYRRTLIAAQAALAAGAPARATGLLDRPAPRATDDQERAQAESLRGAIGVALGQGADRATMLADAARALEPLDVRLARDTYLEALEAAIYTGGLGSDRSLLSIAGAARAAPRARDSEAGEDLLLDGVALLITAGHDAAAPLLRRALTSLAGVGEVRWFALAALAAVEVWDDDALHDLTRRAAALVPIASQRAQHGLQQLRDLDAVVSGRFGTATAPFAELREDASEAQRERSTTLGELLASAWRGRSTEARELAEACMREAFARELGLYVAAAQYAIAVLELGLGQYEAALGAAREACKDERLFVVTSTFPELVEAAARMGERRLAVSAVRRLETRALSAGSNWALGTLARSRALLESGSEAEDLYREAIERLRRCRAAPQLARAHLVYGEWLRRERRRREAREQLRSARDMFVFMGAQAYAERARMELAATGEQALRRTPGTRAETLTAQEDRIARLVADGASNAEVAAQLFISPRTVEYHLHKVFRKLSVSSRTQLARALSEPDVNRRRRTP